MHAAAVPLTPALPAGWSELASHREALVRFARRHVWDPALAEDAVHDVFEAVLSGRAVFAGRSALRTWLVAVLKHKIVDLVRDRAGDQSLCDDDCAGDDPAYACRQPLPDEVAEQRERLGRTLARIDALPQNLREVVTLRLVHQRSTEEVCRELKISEDNLFVRVHRARRVLLS